MVRLRLNRLVLQFDPTFMHTNDGYTHTKCIQFVFRLTGGMVLQFDPTFMHKKSGYPHTKCIQFVFRLTDQRRNREGGEGLI